MRYLRNSVYYLQIECVEYGYGCKYILLHVDICDDAKIVHMMYIIRSVSNIETTFLIFKIENISLYLWKFAVIGKNT